MARSRFPRWPRLNRPALALVLGGLWGFLTLVTSACGDGAEVTVEVYHSPACGCCGEYVTYLRDSGFKVEATYVNNEQLASLKNTLGIPQEMQACHTGVFQDYFVEGHVPMETIRRLLDGQPKIDGIALPGMPPGSPGMGGVLRGPLIVYSVADGEIQQFARY